MNVIREQGGLEKTIDLSGKQIEAYRIHAEPRSLALNSQLRIRLTHRGIHIAFREGQIISLEAYFERQAEVSFYRQYYGFSEKRIRAGLIHVLEYRRTEHENIEDKKSMLVPLWPGHMLAKSCEALHQGEPIQLEPIELHALNAFSFLSLATLYIQEHFGGCLAFMNLLGTSVDMQGINEPALKEGQEVSPLFAGGLMQFLLNYVLNRDNARDDLDAFRSYLERAGMASLAAPLLLSERHNLHE
ncbi:hypothetical protein [Ktedonobacter racemifer]|uniref:Uncharacterized protein n=1 Tax=Ktedonobacter racemifer DSM 44963 TaxID=485913 RepID=D6TCU0_KTERA|nr:hypothetical protein [Ktedonobacter racemifer]EFH88204.1 hypothetical protein Krac_9617 [Ktedonobacter racemifer DSM 44963]